MAILLHLPLLLSLPSLSSSTSPAASPPSTVGWVSNPDNGRGTFSLVTSCLFTLVLCVWSAIHLNVPSHKESQPRFWLRSIKWSMIGVFAPELVVFTAWRQHISATVLQTIVQDCNIGDFSKPNGNPSDLNRPNLIHPWTIVHGFYSSMGGFVFDVESFGPEKAAAFNADHSRLTLTARGVALLARCGHLPRICEEDIVDKAKSDGLAKFVACLQAGWMIVQVLSRIILGLPVSLLEINTSGHVLCAFIIYVLWWKKPRSVYEPTKLEENWAFSLCAYMYMSSKISAFSQDRPRKLFGAQPRSEIAALLLFERGGKTESLTQKDEPPKKVNVSSGVITTEELESSVEHDVRQTPDTSSIHIIASPETFDINSGRSILRDNSHMTLESSQKEWDTRPEQLPHAPEILTPEQLARRRLASQAINHFPAIRSRFQAMRTNNVEGIEEVWSVPMEEELVAESAGNWPNEGLLRAMGGLIMGTILWFASTGFGAVHIAAWNAHFPSSVEAWLWRCSAIFIAFCGLLWMMINLFAQVYKPLDTFWDRFMAMQGNRASYMILGFLCSLCGFAYAFARIFPCS